MKALILLISLVLAAPTWSSDASESEEEVLLRFNLETSRYFDRKEFYITDGMLVEIDKSITEDVDVNRPSTLFPSVSVRKANQEDLQEFLDDILALGVFDWEIRYQHPDENEKGFLCHFGWSLMVKTTHQQIFSEGYCVSPNELEAVIARTHHLFELNIP